MDTAWVCWSIDRLVRDSARDNICIHFQGDDSKTLCGVATVGHWDFEAHDTEESVNCKRCLKIKAKGDRLICKK